MLALIAWLQAHTNRDERGVTAIEYGLLATLIAIAFILGATALGGALDAMFSRIAGML